MDKPTKPTNLMPRSFGGTKNNFSASLQSSGYEDGVPAIYGGDNLNYQIDATGRELDYCETICDFINELPIGKTLTVDSNNKLVYANLVSDVSNKANVSLDNLNTTGTNKVLPTQTGNSGKFLTTNGTSPSWGVPDIVNKDLSNLSQTGESRLHALKAYSDKGELLTDVQGLADVTTYAHSSFDLSKFTVVGTPVITDDGIATDYSGTKYLSWEPVSYFNGKSWVIETAFIYKTLSSSTPLFNFGYNVSDGGIGISTVNGIIFAGQFGDVTTNVNAITFPSFLTNATVGNRYKVQLAFNYNTGVYTLKYWGLDDNLFDSATYTPTTSDKQIRYVYQNNSVPFKVIGGAGWTGIVPIDLKHFNITINDIPTVSGNKTGIDTIKPVDFTAVENGTSVPNPTLPVNNGLIITEDGVASGFSGSNYLTGDSISLAKPFTIYGKIKPSAISADQSFCSIYDITFVKKDSLELRITSAGKFSLFLSSNGTSWDIANDKKGTYTALANTEYFYKLVFTGSTYTFYYSLDGENYISDIEVTSSSTVYYDANLKFILGVRGYTSNSYVYPFSGSIDLNAFKIYVDGNLVYQPCLKIPYTESKTGSKIVNSVYRDRVQDAFEQGLSNEYFTLDETNGNFTLPMGNLYGMINAYADTIKSINTEVTEITNYVNRGFVSSAKDISSGTTSLTTYLPNDSYTYNVWVYNNISSSSSTAKTTSISTDVFPTTYIATTDGDDGRDSANRTLIVVPVGSGRSITVDQSCKLKGYMRI